MQNKILSSRSGSVLYFDLRQVFTAYFFGIRLKSLVVLFWLLAPGAYADDSDNMYEFDDSMLVGSAKEQNSIARFNHASHNEPGTYQVDIFINGAFLTRQSLLFSAVGRGLVSPCFTHELLLESGIRPDSIKSNATDSAQCFTLEQQVDGASSHFDLARLRLDVFVPQASMHRMARGAVMAKDLSPGDTVGFVNYDSNYYRTQASGNTTESTYLGLNSGFNLGLWQFRQQSTFSRLTSDVSPDRNHWNSVRNYVQRPLPSIGSQLTVGDSFTSGSLFSSLGFRGVQLATDDRMLPESQRGYAPTIRGVAATTAKVSVSQSGVQIYQTTVAPGAFVIDDLYPTSYQGDLVVEVQEADGRVSSFTVPFSAVSDSMRPGQSRMNFSAGEVRNIGNSDAKFVDLTYQAGLTNAITANSGVRVSDGYQSLLGGAVLASRLGSLGLNATYSRANMWGTIEEGWLFGATYSRTFAPTSTTFGLTGYRYSTGGYRDLSDVLGQREVHNSNNVWSSSTFEQSNQFIASISQGLGGYGQLYFSGSTSTYRGGRGRDTQYQMAYSNNYNSISYNLSLSRQQTGKTQTGVVSEDSINDGKTQNIIMFSFSVPWGSGSRAPYITTGVTHEVGENTHYQTALSGTLGEDQKTSYAVNGTFNAGGEGGSLGGNVVRQLPVVTVGGNLSQGRNYTQGGLSARGSAVAHSGGITLGPYLGDTFAVIEADGVKGAEVMNGMGAKVNDNGYAVVPSLVPYRFNEITLDAKGIENPNTELTENQQRIAPYAGAIVKVRFKTLKGYALLIKLNGSEDNSPPLGSNVYDSDNNIIGLVGQSNQIYARASGVKGMLRVKWGEDEREQCSVTYNLENQDLKQPLYRLELPCKG